MSKREFWRFLKPKAIPNELICVVCTEVFFDARKLPCGHVLCDECLRQWAKKKKTCPLCRKSFRLKEIVVAGEVMSMVKAIYVHCKFDCCYWSGKISDLELHEAKCEFSPVKHEREVLERLPVYCKSQEEDEQVIALSTLLFEKYPLTISKVLLSMKNTHSNKTVQRTCITASPELKQLFIDDILNLYN